MADSNLADFAFIEESTWGTTPASALQTLRITGESLADQEESTESAEILSDRQLRDVIRTGRFSQGDASFELSAATLDTLLQGVMADTWASNVLENGATKKSFTFE
ncbi:MAG: phage tail tube protein, partial [Acidobacteria bacterium]|nr:phage tail tube protein [Acidobacteriota bacterium]